MTPLKTPKSLRTANTGRLPLTTLLSLIDCHRVVEIEINEVFQRISDAGHLRTSEKVYGPAIHRSAIKGVFVMGLFWT